jgi:hypothetical protein
VGLEPIFDHADTVLEEMVSDGVITTAELSRMTLKAHPRRRHDLLEPFERSGQFRHLIVEDFQMSEVSDGAWNQYKRDRDKEALATRRALFFRSIFVPSLACALSPQRSENGDARDGFADQVEQRLKRHLASRPTEMRTRVQTMLLAKSPVGGGARPYDHHAARVDQRGHGPPRRG